MRLKKLDGYVRSLRQLQAVPLNEYLDDDNLQTIVERKLQLAIQVCMDIASYLIAQLGLGSPEEPENIFAVLGKEGLLSRDLAHKMTGTVRLRNILIHDYLEIDPSIVHHNLVTDLDDMDRFAQEITARFLAPG